MQDGRALHLRRFGRGPALIMLHESPRSSMVLLPLARLLAQDFTVFAVDTPGYGASDPLTQAAPEMGDFAEAILRGFRAIGVPRAFVYGTHTGATIAAAMAQRVPDFVAGMVMDGYPAFTAQEKESHLNFYLPDFAPQWDGSHVMRLWWRVRDQYAFFPWYLPGHAARLTRDPPDPARHNAVVQDILAAGPAYATAYAASFRFEAVAALAGLRMPACVMAHSDDLLFDHLDRLGATPGVTIRRAAPALAARAAAVREAFAAMDVTLPEAPAPQDRVATTLDGALGFAGNMLLRGYGGEADTDIPLLLLHDSPGGAWEWEAVARRAASRRRVLVPELPGHGLSPALPTEDEPALAQVAALVGLLDALGIARLDLGGRGNGAALAWRLAEALPGRVGRLLLVDPPRPSSRAVSELHPFREPSWDGMHLLGAWAEARDRLLYRPWCDRRAETARRLGPWIDVARLHRRFTAQVLSGNDHLALAQALAGARLPMDFAATRAAVLLPAEDPDVAALVPLLRSSGLSVDSASGAACDDQAVAWLAL